MRFVENYYDGSFEQIIHKNVKKIFEKKTKFQNVQILEFEKYGRALVLDGEIQSAVNDEFIYHESLVHPAMCCHSNPRRILILGGGEGATLREVLKYGFVTEAVMVDIDGELVDICREYLTQMNNGSFESDKADLIIDDAMRFLQEAKYFSDVIIADLSNPVSSAPARKAWSEDFFALAAAHLHNDGIFVTQAQALSELECSSHLFYRKMIAKYFFYVYSYRIFVPSYHQAIGFIFATNDKRNNPLSVKRTMEFKYYSQKIHSNLFSLSPFLKAELGQN